VSLSVLGLLGDRDVESTHALGSRVVGVHRAGVTHGVTIFINGRSLDEVTSSRSRATTDDGVDDVPLRRVVRGNLIVVQRELADTSTVNSGTGEVDEEVVTALGGCPGRGLVHAVATTASEDRVWVGDVGALEAERAGREGGKAIGLGGVHNHVARNGGNKPEGGDCDSVLGKHVDGVRKNGA
jgi:hypothetical protein